MLERDDETFLDRPVDRRGASLRCWSPDGAPVAAAVRHRGTAGACRPEFTAGQLSAPDAACGRGSGRGAAPSAPWMGATHDPQPSRPGRGLATALALGDLPGAGPSPADRAEAPAETGQRVQALGAGPCDGAVADGHHPRGAVTRRLATGDRDRDRRPLAVLRVCQGGRAGHGRASLRRAAGGDAASRSARGDSHRQRQGLHGSFRSAEGGGDVRPDLPRTGHPPPADRPGVPADDRQGGAVPQDDEAGVSGRPRVRVGCRGAGGARRVGARLQRLP